MEVKSTYPSKTLGKHDFLTWNSVDPFECHCLGGRTSHINYFARGSTECLSASKYGRVGAPIQVGIGIPAKLPFWRGAICELDTVGFDKIIPIPNSELLHANVLILIAKKFGEMKIIRGFGVMATFLRHKKVKLMVIMAFLVLHPVFRYNKPRHQKHQFFTFTKEIQGKNGGTFFPRERATIPLCIQCSVYACVCTFLQSSPTTLAGCVSLVQG